MLLNMYYTPRTLRTHYTADALANTRPTHYTATHSVPLSPLMISVRHQPVSHCLAGPVLATTMTCELDRRVLPQPSLLLNQP